MWGLMVAGVIVLAIFVVWQAVKTKGEPLLPLGLFRDRNFSLANGAISAVGLTVTSMSLPLFFYFQLVLGLTPTESAFMHIPMAVVNAGLARPLGWLVDRVNPRNVAIACVWSPISTTVTRNLPQIQAGDGSGVYNTTRQVGSVLGSAAVGALMQVRLTAELPGEASGATEFSGALPESPHAGFSNAMAQSLLLPAGIALVCAIIVAFFAKPRQTVAWTRYSNQRPGGPSGQEPAEVAAG